MTTIFYFILAEMFMINMNSILFFSSEIDLTTLNIFVLALIIIFAAMNVNFPKWMLEKELIVLYSTLVFCSVVVFSSANIFTCLLALEASVAPMVLLINKLSKDEDKMNSSFMMMSFNAGFSFLVLFAMNFSFMENSEKLMSMFQDYRIFKMTSQICMLMTISIMLAKTPVFLLHFWLNKAHVSAYSPVSMFLAGIMLKMGTLFILKMMEVFWVLDHSYNSNIFFTWSMLTYLAISLTMVRSLDLKLYVALSSIVHMSFIYPSIMFFLNLGLYSSIFMMVGHGISSMGLFLLLSTFYEQVQSRTMPSNKSMESTSKMLSLSFLIMMMLNLGLPPFINFLSEILLVAMMNIKSLIHSSILCIFMMFSIVHCFNLILSLFFYKNQKTWKNFNSSLKMPPQTMIVLSMSILTMSMLW